MIADLLPSSVEMLKTRSYDMDSPRLKRMSTSSRLRVFEWTIILIDIGTGVSRCWLCLKLSVGSFRWRLELLYSKSCDRVRACWDPVEQLDWDSMFGPFNTIETSAKSDTELLLTSGIKYAIKSHLHFKHFSSYYFGGSSKMNCIAISIDIAFIS